MTDCWKPVWKRSLVPTTKLNWNASIPSPTHFPWNRHASLFLSTLLFPKTLEADLDERVEHLVLVVHGIGDALMSVDLGVVQLRSLVECCDTLRAHHEEVGGGGGLDSGGFIFLS